MTRIEKLFAVLLLLPAACGTSSRRGPAVGVPIPPSPRPEISVETTDPLVLLQPGEYRSASGETLPYRLFVPPSYDASSKYPLVVFLHGASASGIDNQRQLTGSGFWGTAVWVSDVVQSIHPSFVLAPQANPRRGSAWVDQWSRPEDPAGGRQEPLELVIELIDRLATEFAIDEARLYVTGISMGGFGAWSAITRYPEKFAAAVPVCGGGDPSSVGRNQTAVWAFHGLADQTVPVHRSQEMIEAFRVAGAEAKYTEYPGLAHDIWERAYQDPGLVPWLFSQQR